MMREKGMSLQVKLGEGDRLRTCRDCRFWERRGRGVGHCPPLTEEVRKNGLMRIENKEGWLQTYQDFGCVLWKEVEDGPGDEDPAYPRGEE